MVKLSNRLRGRIAEIVKQPFKKVNKDLLVLLHKEVFSSNLCRTCENEQLLAYIELTRLIYPKMSSITPPSKRFRFNPRKKAARVAVNSKRWVVTAETLTDEQAKFMMNRGVFGDLIVTVEDYERIQKEMVQESEVVEPKPRKKRQAKKKS